MEVLILGVNYTLVHGFCFFKLFPSYRVYSVKAGFLMYQCLLALSLTTVVPSSVWRHVEVIDQLWLFAKD